jgi:uncharacterized protein (DUF1501 family)
LDPFLNFNFHDGADAMFKASRRRFLASISAAASAASAGLVSLAPRAPGFLLESAAYGADRPGENVLVVVQLSGGNDGLNTVVPYTDEIYKKKRRASLAIDASQVLKIDGSLGFHPSLKGFSALLENRQLAIVQGVGYPNPNRSHFESMDIWHSARMQAKEQVSGWLGRAFDSHKGMITSIDPPGVHLGDERQPLALSARNVPSPSIRSLAQFKLETGNDERQRAAIEAAVGVVRSNPSELLRFIQTRSTSALEVSRRIEASNQVYKTSVTYPGTPLAQKLKRIAQLIDAGLTTRVYYVALDGFDTHSDQPAAHAGLLDQLGGALGAFAEDLNAHSHLNRVTTLVFSEFGRRVEENASRGTDHGAAAPVFLVGNRVRSGLIGSHPRLDDLSDGDLKFHTDFRSVYAALLEKWLGWSAVPILGEGCAPMDVISA